MQGQEAIFSFKVLKSSAYKDARALQVKRKWCLKLKNYPLTLYGSEPSEGCVTPPWLISH